MVKESDFGTTVRTTELCTHSQGLEVLDRLLGKRLVFSVLRFEPKGGLGREQHGPSPGSSGLDNSSVLVVSRQPSMLQNDRTCCRRSWLQLAL